MSNYQISILGSMYFIGYTIACLTMLRLADTYGRKKLFILN